MTTLTVRAYQEEADLDLHAIAALIGTCDAYDGLEQNTSVQELRLLFDNPAVDKQRDLCLWEDDHGQVVAYTFLWVRPAEHRIDAQFAFAVHPSFRGPDLESQVVTWAVDRMRTVDRERGADVTLHARVQDGDVWRNRVLGEHNATPVRYFFRMLRSLDQPIPAPQLPEGFVLRTIAGTHEVPAWVEMFNQSFVDHWNFHPMTAEFAVHYMENDPHYLPDLDLIIVAPDGTFAAFCCGSIGPEKNQRTDLGEGSIDVLGTRRGYRKLGLGRAILLEGLRRLKSHGADVAELTVDAENPTGATRLYESAGFRVALKSTIYSMEL